MTAFATTAAVAARRGPLSDDQEATAEALLESAAGIIADAAGKDAAWIEALDPIPPILVTLSVEMVVRVLANPNGASSVSEQLGAYQRTEGFRGDTAGGLFLSAREERLVRRAVYGRSSGSARPESIANVIYPEVPVL